MQRSTQRSAALSCGGLGASRSVPNLASSLPGVGLRHNLPVKPAAILYFGRKTARGVVANAEEKSTSTAVVASLVGSIFLIFSCYKELTGTLTSEFT